MKTRDSLTYILKAHILKAAFASTLLVGLISCGGGESNENGLLGVGNPMPTAGPADPQPPGSSPSPSPDPSGTPVPTDTGSPSPNPTGTPGPGQKSSVSMNVIDGEAFEKENQFAKIIVERNATGQALSVRYRTEGAENPVNGSAQSDDYQLFYSEGGALGSSIEFSAAQSQRVIEIRPVKDSRFEVPETLAFQILEDQAYQLGQNAKASVVIKDGKNTRENAKVFIGVFGPQGNAATGATGSLSLILQGDNLSAKLNYNFFNLTTEQTDQHIHLLPAGNIVKDIEKLGPVSAYDWDLLPGGIFVTRQEMLDALFDGSMYLNIHTANFPAGEISATFIYDEEVEPPTQTPLTADDVDRDIIRFLTQATFGPRPQDYALLRSQISEDGSNRIQVFDAWIESQFRVPQSSLFDLTVESSQKFNSTDPRRERRDGFWTMAAFSKDQLRQRIALALSEILVVSDSMNVVSRSYLGAADYWDMLARNATTSYRQALGESARHPIMGVWLSHLRNQKANPSRGTSPDENFAREIMQLFGFGLLQRQENGRIKLGNDSLPIATYDNDVIQEMARVFTGLAFAATYNDAGERIDNTRFYLGNGPNDNDLQYRWLEPLKFFPAFHDYGEKTLFTDENETVVIPASGSESEAAAEAELDTVLDAIVAHSSSAPHVSRLLIKRFVTSNPSAEYISRVVSAYGDTGDMQSVIKAILLDPEARNPAILDSQSFGKAKEPVLVFTSLLRLLDGASQLRLGGGQNGLQLRVANQYDNNASILRAGFLNIGQRTLSSPTVFNFFLPDFSPSGELALNSLSAPEFQLINESQLYLTMNEVDRLLRSGLVERRAYTESDFSQDQVTVKIAYNKLTTLWNQTQGNAASKAEAVVDFLDFYLNAGQLRASGDIGTRMTIIDIVANASEAERFNLAVYGMVNAPQVMIQR